MHRVSPRRPPVRDAIPSRGSQDRSTRTICSPPLRILGAIMAFRRRLSVLLRASPRLQVACCSADATGRRKAPHSFLDCRHENFKMPVDSRRQPPYMRDRRPDGGIGRRASFRCWYSKGCGGSSPLLGTKFPFQAVVTALKIREKPGSAGLFSFPAPTRSLSADTRQSLLANCGDRLSPSERTPNVRQAEAGPKSQNATAHSLRPRRSEHPGILPARLRRARGVSARSAGQPRREQRR